MTINPQESSARSPQWPSSDHLRPIDDPDSEVDEGTQLTLAKERLLKEFRDTAQNIEAKEWFASAEKFQEAIAERNQAAYDLLQQYPELARSPELQAAIDRGFQSHDQKHTEAQKRRALELIAKTELPPENVPLSERALTERLFQGELGTIQKDYGHHFGAALTEAVSEKLKGYKEGLKLLERARLPVDTHVSDAEGWLIEASKRQRALGNFFQKYPALQKHPDFIAASKKAFETHDKAHIAWQAKNVLHGIRTVKLPDIDPDHELSETEFVESLKKGNSKTSVNLRDYWKHFESDNRVTEALHERYAEYVSTFQQKARERDVRSATTESSQSPDQEKKAAETKFSASIRQFAEGNTQVFRNADEAFSAYRKSLADPELKKRADKNKSAVLLEMKKYPEGILITDGKTTDALHKVDAFFLESNGFTTAEDKLVIANVIAAIAAEEPTDLTTVNKDWLKQTGGNALSKRFFETAGERGEKLLANLATKVWREDPKKTEASPAVEIPDQEIVEAEEEKADTLKSHQISPEAKNFLYRENRSTVETDRALAQLLKEARTWIFEPGETLSMATLWKHDQKAHSDLISAMRWDKTTEIRKYDELLAMLAVTWQPYLQQQGAVLPPESEEPKAEMAENIIQSEKEPKPESPEIEANKKVLSVGGENETNAVGVSVALEADKDERSPIKPELESEMTATETLSVSQKEQGAAITEQKEEESKPEASADSVLIDEQEQAAAEEEIPPKMGGRKGEDVESVQESAQAEGEGEVKNFTVIPETESISLPPQSKAEVKGEPEAVDKKQVARWEIVEEPEENEMKVESEQNENAELELKKIPFAESADPVAEREALETPETASSEPDSPDATTGDVAAAELASELPADQPEIPDEGEKQSREKLLAPELPRVEADGSIAVTAEEQSVLEPLKQQRFRIPEKPLKTKPLHADAALRDALSAFEARAHSLSEPESDDERADGPVTIYSERTQQKGESKDVSKVIEMKTEAEAIPDEIQDNQTEIDSDAAVENISQISSLESDAADVDLKMDFDTSNPIRPEEVDTAAESVLEGSADASAKIIEADAEVSSLEQVDESDEEQAPESETTAELGKDESSSLKQTDNLVIEPAPDTDKISVSEEEEFSSTGKNIPSQASVVTGNKQEEVEETIEAEVDADVEEVDKVETSNPLKNASLETNALEPVEEFSDIGETIADDLSDKDHTNLEEESEVEEENNSSPGVNTHDEFEQTGKSNSEADAVAAEEGQQQNIISETSSEAETDELTLLVGTVDQKANALPEQNDQEIAVPLSDAETPTSDISDTGTSEETDKPEKIGIPEPEAAPSENEVPLREEVTETAKTSEIIGKTKAEDNDAELPAEDQSNAKTDRGADSDSLKTAEEDANLEVMFVPSEAEEQKEREDDEADVEAVNDAGEREEAANADKKDLPAGESEPLPDLVAAQEETTEKSILEISSKEHEQEKLKESSPLSTGETDTQDEPDEDMVNEGEIQKEGEIDLVTLEQNVEENESLNASATTETLRNEADQNATETSLGAENQESTIVSPVILAEKKEGKSEAADELPVFLEVVPQTEQVASPEPMTEAKNVSDSKQIDSNPQSEFGKEMEEVSIQGETENPEAERQEIKEEPLESPITAEITDDLKAYNQENAAKAKNIHPSVVIDETNTPFKSADDFLVISRETRDAGEIEESGKSTEENNMVERVLSGVNASEKDHEVGLEDAAEGEATLFSSPQETDEYAEEIHDSHEEEEKEGKEAATDVQTGNLESVSYDVPVDGTIFQETSREIRKSEELELGDAHEISEIEQEANLFDDESIDGGDFQDEADQNPQQKREAENPDPALREAADVDLISAVIETDDSQHAKTLALFSNEGDEVISNDEQSSGVDETIIMETTEIIRSSSKNKESNFEAVAEGEMSPSIEGDESEGILLPTAIDETDSAFAEQEEAIFAPILQTESQATEGEHGAVEIDDKGENPEVDSGSKIPNDERLEEERKAEEEKGGEAIPTVTTESLIDQIKNADREAEAAAPVIQHSENISERVAEADKTEEGEEGNSNDLSWRRVEDGETLSEVDKEEESELLPAIEAEPLVPVFEGNVGDQFDILEIDAESEPAVDTLKDGWNTVADENTVKNTADAPANIDDLTENSESKAVSAESSETEEDTISLVEILREGETEAMEAEQNAILNEENAPPEKEKIVEEPAVEKADDEINVMVSPGLVPQESKESTRVVDELEEEEEIHESEYAELGEGESVIMKEVEAIIENIEETREEEAEKQGYLFATAHSAARPPAPPKPVSNSEKERQRLEKKLRQEFDPQLVESLRSVFRDHHITGLADYERAAALIRETQTNLRDRLTRDSDPAFRALFRDANAFASPQNTPNLGKAFSAFILAARKKYGDRLDLTVSCPRQLGEMPFSHRQQLVATLTASLADWLDDELRFAGLTPKSKVRLEARDKNGQREIRLSYSQTNGRKREIVIPLNSKGEMLNSEERFREDA